MAFYTAPTTENLMSILAGVGRKVRAQPLDVRRRGLWATGKETAGRARVGKANLDTEGELLR